MAGGLDAFLNVAVPLAIFFFLGFKIYSNLQEPIDKFFAWVGEKIDGPEEVDEGGEINIWDAEIEYR